MKRLFKWLGVEANSRAITALLGIGAAIGALAMFAVTYVLPIISPELASTDYGEGYRRGVREAECQSLERALEAIEQRRRLDQEFESMTPEERSKLVDPYLRD